MLQNVEDKMMFVRNLNAGKKSVDAKSISLKTSGFTQVNKVPVKLFSN